MLIKKPLAYLGFVMVITCSIQAEEMESDTEVFASFLGYENVRITNIEPDRVSFTHENGIASLPIEKIPIDLREKIGISIENANLHREKVNESNQRLAKQRHIEQLIKDNTLVFDGEIFQILEDGVLLKDVIYTDGSRVEKVEKYKVRIDGPSTLTPTRPERFETRERRKWETKVSRMDVWPIYVKTRSLSEIDGNNFSATVFPIGIYSYETRVGTYKSVPAYTTSVDEFLAHKGVILGKKDAE